MDQIPVYTMRYIKGDFLDQMVEIFLAKACICVTNCYYLPSYKSGVLAEW